MHNLQNKIFILFVTLLISIQTIVFLAIDRVIDEQAQQSIDLRLTNASTLFVNLFESRTEKLTAIVEIAAHDSGLRENFYEDQKSFLYALNNYRNRINADLVLAINDKGIIKSQLIKIKHNTKKSRVIKGSEVNKRFKYLDWLSTSDNSLIYPLDGKLYQLSFAPINSGSNTIGWIGFGFLIGQSLAREFSDLTDLTADFILVEKLKRTYIASSTNRKDKKVKIQEKYSNIVTKKVNIDQIGVNNKVQFFVELSGSRDDLLQSIHERWLELIAIATFTLLLSLAGTYLISSSISRPVKKLVQKAKFIAQGNYGASVTIDDKGEFGQLANEFNTMQKEVLKREKLISHSAFHDSLTNLPNRNKLINVLNSMMVERNKPFLVYFINISHIKDINNSLGHQVGNNFIQELSKRLLLLGGESQCFHVGSDEFILLFSNADENKVDVSHSAVTTVLNSPYINDSLKLNMAIKVGIASFPKDSHSSEELIQNANTAMQIAKQRRLPYQIYNPKLEINTLEQLSLMNDLSIAIKENQLILFYQPKVSLLSGNVESVEALIRWQHPEKGMIPPDKFIPIAEKTGQINPLTRWVLTEAASQFAKWRKFNINLPIAVNISAENLKANSFFDDVCGIISREDIPLNSIVLEITESAVVDDPKKVVNLLQCFRKKGFKLSIDDYGTGYSSLAQLKDLPVDELKIDMSFILNLPNDNDDKIIVRSTIELAHNMGLTVVAEGVENNEAMQWLKINACEKVQGYHICKPLPADEFQKWLETTSYYRNV